MLPLRRPLRFGTQLLLLLGIALVLADAVVAALWWHASGGLHPIAREQALSRLTAVYRLAEVARPARIGVLLDAAQSPEARFAVQAGPGVSATPMNADELAIAQSLQQRLGVEARVHLGPLDRLDEGSHARLPAWWPGQQPLGLAISLALPDGRWLHGRLGPMDQPGNAALTAGSLLVSAVLVGALMMLGLRRVLRPWHALSDTMKRFGRGERPDPLPLRGPRELRELSASFNELQARVSRFVDERTRLLASISHDLRTPVTVLRLRAEMVDDPALRAAMLRTLADLETLVNETLHFARDEGQDRTEAPQRFDLSALCRRVAEERRAAGHEIALALPERAVHWQGQALALQRALGNLIDNAVRHGQRARVTLQAPDAEGNLRIDIDDDGPGIPEALLDQVFEPFFRGDTSRSNAGGGVGLGLVIAQSCVQAQGGTLTLSNRPEGGLRARILLPS